jgi:hypothetical protein
MFWSTVEVCGVSNDFWSSRNPPATSSSAIIWLPWHQLACTMCCRQPRYLHITKSNRQHCENGHLSQFSHAEIHKHTNIYIKTHTHLKHTYIHTYRHIYIHTYIHTYHPSPLRAFKPCFDNMLPVSWQWAFPPRFCIINNKAQILCRFKKQHRLLAGR